jgi:hypothetical protein
MGREADAERRRGVAALGFGLDGSAPVGLSAGVAIPRK